MEQTLAALEMVTAAHRAAGWVMDFLPAWWIHQIVLEDEAAGDSVVGDIGFHGPPSAVGPVDVEIGYSVVAGLRGRGIATRACGLLLELSWRDGADVVRAETDPDNHASRRVLLRSGFTPVGCLRFVIEKPSSDHEVT